jgi:hypothetical protein
MEDMDVKYRATLFMAGIAIIFLVLHFWTGWEAFVDEEASHGQAAEWNQYLIVWVRDTVENMQSEFWQLAVQFALLAGLFGVIGVRAYEEDEEDVKDRLTRIEETLNTLAKNTGDERRA